MTTGRGVTKLLALALFLQAAQTTTALDASDFPKLTKLDEHVFVWSDVHPSGLYTTNNLIVITTDGVLVADGQRDEAATKKLVDGIAGLTRQPIKVVVIGSDHGDHTGGHSSFPAGIAVIKSPLPEGRRKTLRLGATDIDVLDMGRAHTGTDLEVYLPEEKILFTSEAFSHRIFPNMRAAVPAEWIQTVKNLGTIDARTVIPGHGFVEDGPTMKRSLAEFQDALESIVKEATRLHEAGMSVDEAARLARWGPYAGWTASDRNARVAIQRVYDALDGTLR